MNLPFPQPQRDEKNFLVLETLFLLIFFLYILLEKPI